MVLLVVVENQWQTVRLYDNHLGTHHMHRYIARSKNTPATDSSFDLLARIAVDPGSDERYPTGMTLIPSDAADASILISRAIRERRPMAVVFPDGSDVVARPPTASGVVLLIVLAALWLADRANRKRDCPTFVPR